MAKAKADADPLLAGLKKALDASPETKLLVGSGGLFTAKQADTAEEAVRLGYLEKLQQPPRGRAKEVTHGVLTEAGARKVLDTADLKTALGSLLPVVEKLRNGPIPPDPELFRVVVTDAAATCVAMIREAFDGLQQKVVAALSPTGGSSTDPGPVLAALRNALEKVEPVVIRVPSDSPPASSPPVPVVNSGPDVKAIGDEIVALVEQSTRERSVGCDFGDLYDALERRHPTLTIGTFQDTLRALDEGNRIRLSGWSRMLDEMPRPELALFLSHKVMYYAQPAR